MYNIKYKKKNEDILEERESKNHIHVRQLII